MHLNSPSDALTITTSPFSAGVPDVDMHAAWEERPSTLDDSPPILNRYNASIGGAGTTTTAIVSAPPQGKCRKVVYMSFVNVGANPVTIVGKIGDVTVFSFNLSNTVDAVPGMITWTDEHGFLASDTGLVGISNNGEITTTTAP